LAVDMGKDGQEMVKIPVPLIGLEKETAAELGKNNGIYGLQFYQVIEIPKDKLQDLNNLWNNKSKSSFLNKERISQNPALEKEEAYNLIKLATGTDLLKFQEDIQKSLLENLKMTK
jgi:hypothetical protein